MDYTYLLYIAIILIFTKAFGLLSKVIKLPQVVGALVAGIILGPVCLNLVSLDNAPILSNLSEIGVIVLMFAAGLETDIREMKKCGLASSIIALIGVIVPLVGGAATAFLFGTADPTLSTSTFLQDVFVGAGLVNEAPAVAVHLKPGLGAHPEKAAVAGLADLGARSLLAPQRRAVKHHHGVGFVHLGARPEAGLDTVAVRARHRAGAADDSEIPGLQCLHHRVILRVAAGRNHHAFFGEVSDVIAVGVDADAACDAALVLNEFDHAGVVVKARALFDGVVMENPVAV